MLTETDLNTFIGTTGYYRYLAGLKLTDGVKYLADEAGAYWLLDIIASYQLQDEIRREPFQVWELKLSPNNATTGKYEAVVTMKTDTNRPLLVKQQIEYTDFPLDSITLYLIDGVILLTSEY